MTLDQALGRLKAHHDDGRQKHPDIRDRGEALRVLGDYLAYANGEHSSGDDHTKDARFAKRIAQLGGLCVRTLIDLNLTDETLE